MSKPEDHLSVLLAAFSLQLSTGHARIEHMQTDHIGEMGHAEIRFTYRHPLVHDPEPDKPFRERIITAAKGHLTDLEFGLALIVTGEALDKIGAKIDIVRQPPVPVVRPREAG